MNMRSDEIPVKTAENLTGKTFGQLTVLYRVKNEGATRGAKWRCECSCPEHTLVDVLASNLKKGHTTSCGCVQKKRASQTHIRNLIGQRFGKLKVISQGMGYTSPSGKTKKSTWICECDCGKVVEIEGTSLVQGQTQSCGCLGKSKGEYTIRTLLEQYNLSFEQQKTFSSCRFPDTNRLAYFDFYVNNNYIIEFDGKQHFDITPHGYFTQEVLNDIKLRDKFKNNWCQENNILLIRIPYTKLENLTIEDLKPETSSFIYAGEELDDNGED